MHLLKPITFKSEMKMNLSQKEKVHEPLKYTPKIMRRKRGGSLHTYSSRVEGDLMSKHNFPPNTLGNFFMCFEVCKLYYDESSVLFLNVYLLTTTCQKLGVPKHGGYL